MRKGLVFRSKRAGGINRRFRLRRDESGHGGAAPGGEGGGNNGGGNGGDSTGGATGENNNGQSFDAGSFWNDPSSGEQNNGSQQQQQQQQPDPGANVGTTIRGMIDGFTPQPIFNDEIAQQIADGNLEGINTSMQNYGRAIMTQSIGMVAQIMKAFEAQQDAKFRGLIDQSIQTNQTNQSDEQLLAKSFPSFSQPATQPVIRSVFAQSLRHTNGDRTKAVAMTQSMLQAMGQSGRKDFGLEHAAHNADDYLGDGPASLVADLLSSS